MSNRETIPDVPSHELDANLVQLEEHPYNVTPCHIRTYSDILHQINASFLEGAICALDIFGSMPVRRCMDSSAESNWGALRGDWETLGEDMKQVMLVVSEKNCLNRKSPEGDSPYATPGHR